MDEKQLTDDHIQRSEELLAITLTSIEQKQPSQSKLYQKYLHFLNLKPEDEIAREQKRRSLKHIVISEKLMLRDHCRGDMKLIFLQQSKNSDFLSLLVFYGYFRIIVKVLIKDQVSPSHAMCQNSAGNFANIYRVNLFNTETAIKCHHFKKNNIGDDLQSFQAGFSRILKEYVIFVIASKLEAGPHLHSPCGFDIFVYRDCIEFMMEYCEQDLHLCSKIEAQLKESLRRLHSLNIIHFDIKTENICYSHKYKKAVFIDFGLSEAVSESPGWKTFMPFRGSISYCSEEMVQCFNEGPQEVDAYYNDVACLEQSFKEISENKMPVFEHQELIPTNLSSCYIYDVVRFYLIDKDEEKLQDKCRFFKRFHRFILRKYRKNLRQELSSRPISQYSKFIFDFCTSFAKEKEMKTSQNSNRWRSIMDVQNKEDIQGEILHINICQNIKQLCQSSKLSKREQIKAFLLQERSAYQLPQQDIQYLLVLAQSIKIQSNRFTYEEKVSFAAASIRQPQKYKNEDYIEKCIEGIFNYVFQSELTTLKLKILQQIIISIVVFQTKAEQQIIDSFNIVIEYSGDVHEQVRTIFRYLTAISWAGLKTISSFCFENLENQVLAGVKRFLNRNCSEEGKSKVKLLQNIQNLKLNSNIKQMFEQQNRPEKMESKFFKNTMMLDTFTFEHRIYHKYLQLLLRYPSQDRSQQAVKDLETALFNFMLYEKHIFHFGLLQVFKTYLEGAHCIEEQYIFNKFEQFFHPYKFYQHFQIYLSKNVTKILRDRNFLNQGEKTIKNTLINLSKIAQKSIFRQKMKYNFCILKIMEMFNLRFTQVIDLLRVKTGFWKEQFHKMFKNVHEYVNGSHFFKEKIKQSLFFILQQLTTSCITKMTKNEVISELHQYYSTMIRQTRKNDCFQCRTIMYLQARVVLIIILYLEGQFTEAFNMAFQFICFTRKDTFLLNKQMYETFIKYAEPSAEMMLLYFETARFSQTNGLINFSNLITFFSRIYEQLYKRSRFDDIAWFVDQVTGYLQRAVKKSITTQFANRFKIMIKIVNQDGQDQSYFFESHLQLIQRWRHSTNPYLAVFFMILLQSRTRKLPNSFIFVFIARALNNLDYLAKEIILKTYFSEFHSNFTPMPIRRERDLMKKHHRNQSQFLLFKDYLQTKLSNQYLKNSKSSYIKKCVRKYHENIENLK